MPPKIYLYFIIAVAFETFGSTCLQASHQFTRLWPSLGVALGFAGALYFFTQILNHVPLGLTYAMWSGIGIVLIAISGRVLFGQRLDPAALIGIGLIIAGIIVINVFSKTTMH